jgi:hypothetical protein
MSKKGTGMTDEVLADYLLTLGQDVINGRKLANYKDIPKKHVLTALLITYTAQTIDYNVKFKHGYPAKEPPYMQTIIDETCELFEYKGD